MSVREAVRVFIGLGHLPDEKATEEEIAKHQSALLAITKPVTDEEALLMAACFGPDDCFGLAWSLLHLVESAPGGIPVKTKPSEDENMWLRLLWDRSHRTFTKDE